MGTLINAVAIIIGGALGLLFRERFPERITQTALHVMGLFTLLVGVRMAIQGEELIMVLISLALGAMLGEWMNIEDRLERFGLWLEARLHLTEQSPAKGFINASLLFCVGSMAIVGSITEGLNGDRSILVTKAIMDGILSIAFAAGMGVGVLGSALPILLYQVGFEAPGLFHATHDRGTDLGGRGDRDGDWSQYSWPEEGEGRKRHPCTGHHYSDSLFQGTDVILPVHPHPVVRLTSHRSPPQSKCG
jgi:uncharacterized membrane protein YqgA involved in biofilm formation